MFLRQSANRFLFVCLGGLGILSVLANSQQPVVDEISTYANDQQKLIEECAFATISTEAKQAIVMDFLTGAILFKKNAFLKTTPSSMTKLLLMYVSFQAIQDRNIDLNSTTEVSETAWRMPGSKMFLEVSRKVSLEDLIRGIIVQSGNDACVVFAEKLFGSEDVCVQHMNAVAASLGMRSSQFRNTHGLPDDDHFSSVYDLAVLACKFIKDFPQYYHYFSEKEFTYSNIRQYNRNALLWSNIGVDGLKTGLTSAGGYGIVASAVRNGRRIIVVVNGCKSAKSRSQEVRKLIEFGYSQFANHVFADQKGNCGRIKVKMGKKKTVKLAVKDNTHAITVPSNLLKNMKISVRHKEIFAPVRKGDQIAVLKFEFKEKSGLLFEFPLAAAEDVEELNVFERLIEKIKQFASGIWPGS
ncbi:MAG: D-alanyl-D-alanine carboxypeptidase [Holosporales bacterium]|jgi:D-alanyl-D-alanine carboxypeptidase (penicillin-binding protein 5/6)|nr:D-alanyl-D-alanine carboxypeptidase [Holosporales bacterium]